MQVCQAPAPRRLEFCGKWFASRPNVAYCSPACYNRAASRRFREKRASRARRWRDRLGLREPVAWARARTATIAGSADARHPEPALPTGQAIPSAAVAEMRLHEKWGAHYPRQMALAEAALVRLDETRGGPEGALRRRFRETGAANMPEVIQELARYGGLLHGTRDPGFRALVERFEADYRQRSRPGRRS